MRLAKFLAEAGIASRRKAEELISAGRITVNGEKVTSQGFKILPEQDRVFFDDKEVLSDKKVYFILNKPKGYICSLKDEFSRPLVIELVKDCPEKIFPVGRLDLDTEGLLLLTNDGDFAQMIIHPRNGIVRKYEALVAGQLTEGAMDELETGIELEDGFAKAKAIKLIKQYKGKSRLIIEIHIGKKRIVRRMLKKVGFPVLTLKRIGLGKLTLAGLRPGEYRELTPAEIESLRILASLRPDKES